MDKIILIATSTFGLEAVVKRELKDLGFTIINVSDGRVEFEATLAEIPKANIWLRTADRVLFKVGEFEANDLDKLFDGVKDLPWGDWITKDGKIDTRVKAVRSEIKSMKTCQSMVKRAIIDKLKQKYKKEWFDETGPEFTVHVFILKDVAQVAIDTTGAALHKRGYREEKGEVPMRENLAAALVLLSFWKKDRILIDPMCGSGTIVIEAALIGRNIAPGLKRKFVSEPWPLIDERYWQEARESAEEAINKEGDLKIFGYDIDKNRIHDAKYNAKRAGVGGQIIFQQKALDELCIEEEHGVLISNPPYGIKLSSAREIVPIYNTLNNKFSSLNGWSLYILTADKRFPEYFRRSRPDRVRKLFSGTIEVNYYQYYGKRPGS